MKYCSFKTFISLELRNILYPAKTFRLRVNGIIVLTWLIIYYEIHKLKRIILKKQNFINSFSTSSLLKFHLTQCQLCESMVSQHLDIGEKIVHDT